MAKHRQSRTVRVRRWPRGRAALLRGGVLVVLFTICVVMSVQLFGANAGTSTGPRAGTLPNSYRGGTADPAGGATRGRVTAVRPPAARPSRTDPAPPASWHSIAGSSVTAIGDSVMVASTPALEQALPGIYIDAMVGRQFSTGLYVLADLKSRGLLRPIVVFALGTNGTVTGDEISQLFAEIGPHRRLVLVNTFEARSWEQEVNSTLAAAASSHRNAALANWFTAIENRTYLLWADGIHPQPAGGVLYARIVRAAVEKVGNLPGPAPAATGRVPQNG